MEENPVRPVADDEACPHTMASRTPGQLWVCTRKAHIGLGHLMKRIEVKA
jgi:hypothetical protein